MINIVSDARIFIFTSSTDMRKGFHGLISLIQKFSENPLDGSFYVFTNRNRTRLKILYWDGDGFALWYKHLQKGLFDIAQSADGKLLVERRQLMMILEGVEPLKIRKKFRQFRARTKLNIGRFVLYIYMTKILDDSSEKVANLEAENDRLKLRIRLLEKALFGPRSERLIDLDENQPEFDELVKELDNLSDELDQQQEEITQQKNSKRKKKRSLKDLIPDDLPEEEILLDIPADEKEGLVQIGEERSRKLAKKPASYYVKIYVRPKYADKKDSTSGILISDLPDFAIPGSQFDESIIADIAVSKYAYHLPLYRLEEKMKYEGIPVSRQTLSNLLIRGAEVLKPLYNELKKQILSRGVIFTDDTPVKLQVKGKSKKGLTTGRIWVYVAGGAGPPMKVFEFTKDRQKIRPKEFLGDYKGYIHADAYSGYDFLFKSDDVHECACWMHVRRKFIEAEDAPVAFRQKIIRMIRNLYRYERIGKRMTPENRLQLRQEKIKPLINEFFGYIENEMVSGPIILPKSTIGKALNYTIKLKEALKTFLEDSRLEPDNGESERSLRPMTIGRKNWLFMGSKNGGDATALWASIIQTCRDNDVDPFEYISDVLRKINGHPANKIEELLPHNFKN